MYALSFRRFITNVSFTVFVLFKTEFNLVYSFVIGVLVYLYFI